MRSPPSARVAVVGARGRGLGVPQSVDQLALVHLRAAIDAHVGRLLLQLLLRLVLVLRGLAALLRGVAAAGLGVGDACRLLLARAVVAQRLIGLVVLHRGPVVLGHIQGIPGRAGRNRARAAAQRRRATSAT